MCEEGVKRTYRLTKLVCLNWDAGYVGCGMNREKQIDGWELIGKCNPLFFVNVVSFKVGEEERFECKEVSKQGGS